MDWGAWLVTVHGSQRVGHDWMTNTHTHTHTHTRKDEKSGNLSLDAILENLQSKKAQYRKPLNWSPCIFTSVYFNTAARMILWNVSQITHCSVKMAPISLKLETRVFSTACLALHFLSDLISDCSLHPWSPLLPPRCLSNMISMLPHQGLCSSCSFSQEYSPISRQSHGSYHCLLQSFAQAPPCQGSFLWPSY